MKALLLNVIPGKIETMSDKSIKITLSTNELPPEDMAKLFQIHQKPVQCLLSESEVSVDDVKDIPKVDQSDFKGNKSQSKRLRDVIYIHWSQLGSIGDPEQFYNQMTNKFISMVKDKLE